MAIVWIVTIGNSDIRLDANASKAFNTLKDDASKPEKRESLGRCRNWFRPEEDKSKKGEFSLEARVLGIVYGDAIATHPNYFKFPLLDGFCTRLDEEKVKPDRIIILLTDQEEIFLPNHENHLYNRNGLNSPYWKDTCTLEPIFEHYFKNKYDVSIESVFLQPETGHSGLDDWNATLTLVQKKFANFGIDENDKIIVSHQAGTPAISSAVQLTTLIRYGSEVKFLVGSELDSKSTEFIDGSNYFKALQTKKLSDLLERHDYSGMTSIVKDMKFGSDEVKSRLLHLLKQANLWNAAEFEKFAEEMGEPASTRSGEWWWSAYESAYLAVVRLKQENTIEAIFHSFRAVEGLLRKWAENTQPLTTSNGKSIIELPSGKKFNLYGKFLYNCLEEIFSIDANEDIYKFGHSIFDKRNNLFHQLLGKEKSEVFEFWGTSNQIDMEKRIINCLNYISKQSFDVSLNNPLESASLMSQVHKDLEEVIKAIAY